MHNIKFIFKMVEFIKWLKINIKIKQEEQEIKIKIKIKIIIIINKMVKIQNNINDHIFNNCYY
jgi:hypothetical protein